ncbi:MAG TPA: diacylglycerol kinase family protein, partial [Caldilineaceae bacterium]|nr:diacylglycerol kinase family protein [Caldilineaceae bacterium]
MGRIKVILNPYAGRGTGARLRERVAGALRQAGVDFDLVETTAPGEAIALAAAALREGYETVAAAGGDGTANEALNGLAQATPAGERIGRLALLPIGTGNDLADMLGIPRDLQAAAQRVQAGKVRRIDVGR